MATPTLVETLTSATLARKRKADAANLSDDIDASEEKSVDVALLPIEDYYLFRNFNTFWHTFIRPELEKVHAPFLARRESYYPSDEPESPPPPPPPPADEEGPPPLEIPSPPLLPLTHGGGLEDDDQSCVLTQPAYRDCSCSDCTLAATQPIDQYSDEEEV